MARRNRLGEWAALELRHSLGNAHAAALDYLARHMPPDPSQDHAAELLEYALLLASGVLREELHRRRATRRS